MPCSRLDQGYYPRQTPKRTLFNLGPQERLRFPEFGLTELFETRRVYWCLVVKIPPDPTGSSLGVPTCETYTDYNTVTIQVTGGVNPVQFQRKYCVKCEGRTKIPSHPVLLHIWFWFWGLCLSGLAAFLYTKGVVDLRNIKDPIPFWAMFLAGPTLCILFLIHPKGHKTNVEHWRKFKNWQKKASGK